MTKQSTAARAEFVILSTSDSWNPRILCMAQTGCPIALAQFPLTRLLFLSSNTKTPQLTPPTSTLNLCPAPPKRQSATLHLVTEYHRRIIREKDSLSAKTPAMVVLGDEVDGMNVAWEVSAEYDSIQLPPLHVMNNERSYAAS
ncbi:unnamed protein product [Diplocarpon coronariae]|nr:hypothetical protein JHW43_007270 [Diplocarpon mali]